jgi:4-carboxymuconolactone decarboxylase
LKLADPAERRATGISTMAEVMDERPPERPTLLEETIRDFGCAEIWTRPGLDRRSRRWIAISAAASTGCNDPVESYVRSAFLSGDITLAEMREGVLHFAIYSGWPLARIFDRIVTKVAAELKLEAEVPPFCDKPWDPAERYERGKAAYHKIMSFPTPDEPAAYYDAGIKNFVFGEMWERPGLDQRARRWITLSCVGASDTPNPILTHVYAAMNTGDATPEEMHEFVLQFGFELGWPKASVMIAAVFDATVKVQQGRPWM